MTEFLLNTPHGSTGSPLRICTFETVLIGELPCHGFRGFFLHVIRRLHVQKVKRVGLAPEAKHQLDLLNQKNPQIKY